MLVGGPSVDELVDDRQSVLRSLTGSYFKDEANVACPVCGFDYSHVQEVYTALGSDEHEARVYPGTRYKGDRTGGRRSALCIRFAGECRHNWELIVQQNKGVNMLQVRLLLESDEESDEEFGV
jgi:hypothetical protein